METKVGGKDCGGFAEPVRAPPAAARDASCAGKETKGFLPGLILVRARGSMGLPITAVPACGLEEIPSVRYEWR